MKKELTWFGHHCWRLTLGTTRILIDPFFQTDQASILPDQVNTDYILLTHGHSDHLANALPILKKNDATLIAMFEIVSWFEKQGIKNVSPMNIGGMIPLSVAPIRESDPPVPALVMMVPALHSSTMPDGSSGGNPCGFLIALLPPDLFPPKTKQMNSDPLFGMVRPLDEIFKDAFLFYFAGDTGYFSEMNWLGTLGIDVAVLPIGDRFTMGPSHSLDAIRALKPKYVVPGHYNTWSPILQNPQKWEDAVLAYTDAKPIVLAPGESTGF